MNKTIPSSGANAVKIILKNREALTCSLKNKMDGDAITYVFDVFYEDKTGTFNFRVKDGTFLSANLNLLGLAKVITLDNDGNLKKLCDYVLKTFVQ